MVCFCPIGSDEWTQTLNDVCVTATLTVWGHLSGLLNLFTSAWAGGKGHIHSPVVTLITSRFVRHTRDGWDWTLTRRQPFTALHNSAGAKGMHFQWQSRQEHSQSFLSLNWHSAQIRRATVTEMYRNSCHISSGGKWETQQFGRMFLCFRMCMRRHFKGTCFIELRNNIWSPSALSV